MKNVFRFVAALTLSAVLGACTAPSSRSTKVSAAIKGANYTNDYINFTLISTSGVSLGIGGDASPFSKGGIGGTACCAKLAGVGETIRIELKIGGFSNSANKFRTYIRDVTVVGAMPKNQSQEPHSVLIVRFFQNYEVEAELLPGDGSLGPDNLRMDRLFFVGPKVMRHKGE